MWHYDGHTWKQIAATLQGGSALSAKDAWAFKGTMVAHVNGSHRVTKVALPASARKPGSTIKSITRIPGTTQELAGGSTPHVGNPPSYADILLYS